MIESETARIYWVKCDQCGKANQISDAWLEPEWAEENATDNDWLSTGQDTHYCPECAPSVEVCS